MLRALLPRLIASLIAGALLTLLTTWLFAATASWQGQGRMSGSWRYRSPPAGEGMGFLQYEQDLRWGAVTLRSRAGSWSFEWFSGLEEIPPWAAKPLTPWGKSGRAWPKPNQSEEVTVRGFGWPRICLWYEITPPLYPTGPDQARGGLVLPREWGNQRHLVIGTRALPLRPIPAAFALNTLFYAASVLLLTTLPGTLRRYVRRRHGHCLSCGYDLRGITETAPCPECGRLATPASSGSPPAPPTPAPSPPPALESVRPGM